MSYWALEHRVAVKYRKLTGLSQYKLHCSNYCYCRAGQVQRNTMWKTSSGPFVLFARAAAARRLPFRNVGRHMSPSPAVFMP